MQFQFPVLDPVDFYTLKEQIDAFEKHCEDEYGQAGLDAGYGFAHIVIGDLNMEDNLIQFCIDYFPQWVQDRMPEWKSDWLRMSQSLQVAAEVVRVLVWLKTLPQTVREIPEDY